MRLKDFIVDVWQAPIGWIGAQCAYCGEMLWDNGYIVGDSVKHAMVHVEKGDVQRLEDDAEGPRFRVVMGRAPLSDDRLLAKRPAASVI